MPSGWNLSIKKLAIRKMNLVADEEEYYACKKCHNDQRSLVRCMKKWKILLELVVDCYWDEILEWMELRGVRFVPSQPRFVEEFLQNDYDVDRKRFETLLWTCGVEVVDVFDLRRTAIQKILMQRGCVKYRV